jgi:thiol:disulfide interchange protein
MFASGLLYFTAVFAAAMTLGAVRFVWLVQIVGDEMAQTATAAALVVAVVVAAIWVVRIRDHDFRLRDRVGMGLVALGLIAALEFFMVLPMQDLTLAEYAQALEPPERIADALVLLAVLLAPFLVVRPRESAR